jgi:hypothetical protein
MSVGGLRVLRPAALAAVLGASAIAIPHADAAGRTKLHPPTLLWKAYPLVQQARAPEARTTASERREATGPTTAQSRKLDDMLLLTALLATLLAAGTVVFMRRPAAVRAGGSVRRGAGERMRRGPERRPRNRRPEPQEASLPPPLPPEVTAEDEAMPEAFAGPDAAREDEASPVPPPDELQRVLDDLLAALPPGQQLSTEPERIPEVELRDLIVRKNMAPASARPRIELEIDAALERVESRRAAEARARAARRTSLARSEIRLWHGVIKSRLYAVIYGSDDAFAVSQWFRSRDALAPGLSAQRALSSFLAELSRVGWMVVAHGSAWYEHTLELVPADVGGSSAVAPSEGDVLPTIVYKTKNDQTEEGRP